MEEVEPAEQSMLVRKSELVEERVDSVELEGALPRSIGDEHHTVLEKNSRM